MSELNLSEKKGAISESSNVDCLDEIKKRAAGLTGGWKGK